MKFYKLLVILCIVFLSGISLGEVDISNLSSQQISGTKTIEISYDVCCDESGWVDDI